MSDRRVRFDSSRPAPGDDAALAARSGGALNQRLHDLHVRLLETEPGVDRIACATYDPVEDTLKTFINSTRAGVAIADYQFRLADSASLSQLARSGQYRVLDDLQGLIQPNTAHSRWLLEQGYQSSFTVPMYGGGEFLGFIFFDSRRSGVFDARAQRDLVLFCSLINMTIATELNTLRSVVASARIAREFAALRDFETGAHLERMARYSRLIARDVARDRRLGDEFVEHVYLFAPLHDIGKIGIPDRILLKPGRLDDDEREIMKTHVMKGSEIVRKIIGDFQFNDLPNSDLLLHIVEGHHECLDGSGYPRGLVGDAVPVASRIVAVADVFDALTSARPYKDPWDIPSALAELDRMVQAGKLDAACVAALRDHPAEIEAIATRYRDDRVS